MNLDDVKAEYLANGYAKIPRVFGNYEIDAIRDESYRLINTMPVEKRRQVLQSKGNYPSLLFWPQDLSSYMKEVSQDDRLKQIVTYFLGPNVRQLNNQVYFRQSGDKDEFAWHQDICFRTPPADFNNIEEKYLQTIIVVDEIKGNGAVEFIPGSHRWGEVPELVPRDDSEKGLRKFVRGQWKGEKFEAQPGDVLIWSVMVVHGSEQNNSGRNRMTYMNGFCAEDALLNKKRFPIYCRSEDAAEGTSQGKI